MFFILILAPLLAFFVCLLSYRREVLEYTTLAGAVMSAGAALMLAPSVAFSGPLSALSIFTIDSLGAIGILLTAIIGLAVVAYSIGYLREETKRGFVTSHQVRLYFVLLNIFIAAMIIACASAVPIVTWLAIEATTLATVFLINFYNKPTALEAAWKYLLINSFGLLIGFFGTILYLATTIHGGASLVTWSALLAHAGNLDPALARLAFLFVLIGYGTKVGLAPMHTWLPDAHSKAPAPISALLSGVLLNIALITIVRFKMITDIANGATGYTQKLLIAFGLFSIIIAAFIMLTQKNYKRLLAYSSIENMGIMALGFGFGGVGITAALLYMIYHALTKSTLFISSGTIFLTYGTTKIERVHGILATLPTTGFVFFATILSIIGLPPFGTFFSKILILATGFGAHPIVVAAALCAFTIAFIGFLRHTTHMLFGAKPDTVAPVVMSPWLILPPIALLSLLAFLSIYIPSTLTTLLATAATQI